MLPAENFLSTKLLNTLWSLIEGGGGRLKMLAFFSIPGRLLGHPLPRLRFFRKK